MDGGVFCSYRLDALTLAPTPRHDQRAVQEEAQAGGIEWRRREVIAGLASAVAWPRGARAQKGAKVPDVGVLAWGASGRDAYVDLFREGMREIGYAEGRDVTLDVRYADASAERAQAALRDMSTTLLGLRAMIMHDPGIKMAADDLYDAAAALVAGQSGVPETVDVRRWRLLREADARLRTRLASAQPSEKAKLLGLN